MDFIKVRTTIRTTSKYLPTLYDDYIGSTCCFSLWGSYTGGEAGVRKTKEMQKEYTREAVRSAQKNELGNKTEARHERISKIMNMRRGGNRAAATAAATTSTTTGEPTTTSSSVDERHKEVMAKLRASRKEESRKSIHDENGGVVGRLNPFKRK
jgi:hypothetical protein